MTASVRDANSLTPPPAPFPPPHSPVHFSTRRALVLFFLSSSAATKVYVYLRASTTMKRDRSRSFRETQLCRIGRFPSATIYDVLLSAVPENDILSRGMGEFEGKGIVGL